MTTLEPPRSRAQRGNGRAEPDEGQTVTRPVPDWVRRQRRQERRLRRTVFLALVVVIAGAVLARWREDPGTVLVGGVTSLSATLASANDPSASDPGPGAPGPADGAIAAPADPGAATATAHVDTEDEPASEPTPAASQQPVPDAAAGTISAVDIPNGPVKATGRTVTYGIDIEDGLPVGPADFASVVHTVLIDDRGWQTKDGVRFVPVSVAERTAGARADILVTLASPALTAKLCAPLNTSVQQVSCWNGSRAVLNLTRWIRGASTYGNDLAQYRDYLVSHEVGHGLGHGHVHCPGAGKPAPVMVQQTKDLEGCTAWPWPTNA